MNKGIKKILNTVRAWFDSSAIEVAEGEEELSKTNYLRSIPFVVFHIVAIAGVIATGYSHVACAVMVALYVFRMFAITGFYHRYFSHRTFETSRFMQFLFAVAGNSAVQRGPIWWASHHRHHHRYSDQPEDVHSPKQKGFIYSHFGWIFAARNIPARKDGAKDLVKFAELRFLDRFDWVVPVLLAVAMFLLGVVLEKTNWKWAEGTNGPQMLFWGFFLSTVFLFHGTFFINSLCHVWGTQRYKTGDTSTNSLILALITLGEGWHNNHHHYQNSTRQGFFWWEIDLTFYTLKVMEFLRIIRKVRGVPDSKKFGNLMKESVST